MCPRYFHLAFSAVRREILYENYGYFSTLSNPTEPSLYTSRVRGPILDENPVYVGTWSIAF